MWTDCPQISGEGNLFSVSIFYDEVRKRMLTSFATDWLAIFWCIVGCVGLILLSCVSALFGKTAHIKADSPINQFNAFTHGTGHWTMTIVFIVGVAISAVFQSAEIASPFFL